MNMRMAVPHSTDVGQMQHNMNQQGALLQSYKSAKDKEKQDMINSLVRSQFPLAGLVERCEKELKEIDAEMQKMKKGKIKVRDTMYPGVKLSINSIMKNVQTEEKHCCQYVEEEYIRTGPL